MGVKEKVFEEVSKIPKGEVRTYKEIAQKVKTNPRVVARILSENPNPIEVPCHRVIGSDGKLRGYTYKGKRRDSMKEELLKEEGAI